MERELRVVDDLARAGAELFLEAGPRTVALAGGGTPREVYEHLAAEARDFPWRDARLVFGDERCVPQDHADSNYRMVWESLLSRLDPDNFPAVYPMPGATCDAEGYERELRAVFGRRPPVLDLVLLGVGEDGHTASLFPGDGALDEAERWAVRVDRPDHPRLSLTLPVLSAGPLAVFLVAGEAKREALGRLLEGDERIPAARVAAERVVVLADRGAAPS